MGDLQELCNKTHHNRDKEGLEHTLGNVVSTVAHRSAGTHTHTHTHTECTKVVDGSISIGSKV